MSAWHLDELRGLEALDRLEEDWNAMLATCPYHTLFQTFAWCRTYAQHTAGDSSLHVLRLCEGSTLRGIIPLAIRRFQRAGLRLRRLETLGTGPSDRTAFLLPPGIADEALAAILTHVLERLPGWDVWDWRGMMAEVPSHSSLLTHLQDRGVPLWQGPPEGLPVLRITARWDSFYTHRVKASDRSRIDQLWRKLEKRGRLQVRNIVSPEEARGLTERLRRMHHREKGHGAAYRNPFSSPRLRDFMEALTDVAARAGWLQAAIMELDGRLIAYRYDFAYRGAAYAYFSGYDPEFTGCGPGRLLLTDFIHECFRRGDSSFYFLRGIEAYKSAWTDAAEYNLNAFAFRPSLRGRLLRALFAIRQKAACSLTAPD